MPILNELADYLVNASTVFALGPSSTATPIFLSSLPPDNPSEAIGMYEPGGAAPEYTMDGVSFERPTIQVLCRSTSYQTSRSNAQIVYNTFAAIKNQALPKVLSTGVTNYVTVSPVQSPFDMGRDAENRALVSCNYQVQKEVS